MKRILILFLVLNFIGCKDTVSNLDVSVDKTLLKSSPIALFKTSTTNYPKISVHRGGKGLLNFPENCLETLQYVNDSIEAVYEIDVAQTKDGQLILMHDNAINRTTTGQGLVKALNYDQLKDFNLVDDFGTTTNFRIPLFAQVLQWAKANGIILTIDIKRSVSQEAVIKAIREAKAEDISIIITYDLKQAQSAYKLAPDLLLSVSARNHDELDRLLATTIPTENMLAFTGTRLSDISLYQRLHNKDILCMLGTLGNLDQQALAKGDHLYATWKKLGVNILATDRPFEAYNAINK